MVGEQFRRRIMRRRFLRGVLVFNIGQFVMVDDLIAADDGIVTPKGKHLGGCVGKIKIIDEKLRAAILDIKGGETWVSYSYLAPADESSFRRFSCHERYHHSGFMREGEEKLLGEVFGNLATAKFVVYALLICTDDSEGVIRDENGNVVCIKAPKGDWQ